MADFNALFQKAQNLAEGALGKTREVAGAAVDKTRETAARAKVNVEIAGEERKIEKNYRAIGEWFVNEYEGELPEGVRDLAGAIAAARERIEELKASVAGDETGAEGAAETSSETKVCPVCGAESAGQFCPMCGASLE